MKWAAIVLVALVVSYILYLCNLFVIAFGGKRSNPSSAEGEIDDKLKSLLTTCNMDCEFLMIWESQLPVLEELHRSGKRGLSRAEMCKLFRNFSDYYPELAEGSCADDWLQVLQFAEVVTDNAQKFRITDKGLFILNLLEYQKIHPCEERMAANLHHS